jgi:crotonobetainyl-CoA:carnitine CoA-transferase CaiB-like acyl-CoA transferase
MARLPLEGVRVADLTVVWAGPLATKLLADLGAEVIRVESKDRFPSSTKGLAPYLPKELVPRLGYLGGAYPDHDPGERPFNRHAMYNVHGPNKLSCTMELDTPAGQEAFERLIAVSDVMVENNAVRVGERLGFGWERLSRINPRLILVRMPPLGLDGPYANAVGFGAHFEALAGVTYIRGYPEADPTRSSDTFHMDDASGHAVLFAVLAALLHRRKTGRGQFIEVPQAENLMQQMGEAFLDYSMNRRAAQPHGNTHPYFVQGCYPCRGEDQWVVLTVETDAQWDAMTAILGRPDWARDPAWRNALERRRRQDELDGRLTAFFRNTERDAIVRTLQDAGIPAAPVYREADVFADPHFRARRFFRPLTHPETGTHLYPAHIPKYSAMELRWARAAPTLGQDNEYVYRTVLGYREEEYRALERDGLVGTAYPRA